MSVRWPLICGVLCAVASRALAAPLPATEAGDRPRARRQVAPDAAPSLEGTRARDPDDRGAAPSDGGAAPSDRGAAPSDDGDIRVVIAEPAAESERAAADYRALTHALRGSLEPLGRGLQFAEVLGMTPRDVAASSRATTHPQTVHVDVHVWIDLAVRGRATVYVTEGRNVFTRRLNLGGPTLDPVGLDLIDVVVTDSVRSVLAGRPLGVPREEFTRSLDTPPGPTDSGNEPTPRPSSLAEDTGAATAPGPRAAARDVPPPPVQGDAPPSAGPAGAGKGSPGPRAAPPDASSPAPSSASPTASSPAPSSALARAILAADYEAVLIGPSRIVHGPRLSASIDLEPALRLGLSLGGRLPDSLSIADSSVTAHFEALTLRGSAAYLLHLSERSTLLASLGLGWDLGRVSTTANQPGVTPAAAFTTLDTFLRPAFELEHRARALVTSLTLGLDLDLRGARYVIEAAPAPIALAIPWRVRPLAVASAGFAF